jgi:hypothetical protein
MKEIRISAEQFDFPGFFNSMMDFAKDVVDIGYAVAWVKESGDVPVFLSAASREEWLSKMRDEKLILFFMFSDAFLGGPQKCADDSVYEITDDTVTDFYLGHFDVLGYLLQIKNGELIINSGVHFPGACLVPPPSLYIETECGLFDLPMEKFIRTFIKK